MRKIFTDPPRSGFKDPVCWVAAFVLWALVFNAPAAWNMVRDFVGYVLFAGKL